MGEYWKTSWRTVGVRAIAIGVGFVLVIAICLYFALPAFAMIHTTDEIEFGHNTYLLLEYPLDGLWDYGGGKPVEGKEEPPPLDSTWLVNKRGYRAKFQIVDSELRLYEIKGKINGDWVANKDVIWNQKFPIFAKWFSGDIHIEVGGYDYKTDESIYVIILHIENGVVTKTDYAERMKRVGTWNGLPSSNKLTESK